MNSKTETHHIRPAARIIHTLGKGLIKDDLAAIVELVKNSYDADSPDVTIKMELDERTHCLKVVVQDHGHGMSYDTVINKWLVPGTSDKLARKTSPKKKRQLQGRKGIGRYAAGILGQELLLSTVDEQGSKTELLMDWESIIQHEYLDEAEIVVENKKSSEQSGTYIEITNCEKENDTTANITGNWSDAKIDSLITELRKMLSPIDTDKRDQFSIELKFGAFPSEKYFYKSIDIKPIPLLRFYDYRLHGEINKSGKVEMTFENQCVRPLLSEEISTVMDIDTEDLEGLSCGNVKFDLRVFDRDPEAINELTNRIRLNDGTAMKKNEVRRWLNDFNGVGIYRGGFRIRPYGDSAYDWLSLGRRRVDFPTVRIGSNQIIGLLEIDAEEESGLEEKSARDGLVENRQFQLLQVKVKYVLAILEQRRYKFRVDSGRGRRLVNVEETLDGLFDFKPLINDIRKQLQKLNVSDKSINEVTEKIQAVKAEKAKELDNLKETIAFYQGQANLGKMVAHILHEGRKPLAYLRNSIPDVVHQIAKISKKPNDENALNRLTDEAPYLQKQTDSLYNLFTGLDPLTYKKGERAKPHKLHTILRNAARLFSHELHEQNIRIVEKFQGTMIFGRETDFGWIFTNIIENSIYWLKKVDNSYRTITISAKQNDGFAHIEILDNGPGTSSEILENGRIFEPGISLRGGTGMGLATVGELVKRNKGEVWAPEHYDGMLICIRLPATKEQFDAN